MGSENLHLAFANWGHLPDSSFRALAYMAFRTRDDDQPPAFWEGREALAFALGRRTPDEPAPSDSSSRAIADRKEREADFRAVKRALTPLFRVEVVAVLRRPSKAHQAVYSLHLDTGIGGRFAARSGDVSWSIGGRETSDPGTENVPRYGGVGGVETSLKESKESKDNPNSAQALKSPATVENPAGIEELNYTNASAILQRLPDLGQSILAGITGIEGMENRVIAAAAIALQQTRTEAS